MATPICRCRVLYLGSSVPHVTKDGLHGIQEPLRELYPEEGVLGAKGIDSWLSVWSNGLLLENVDEKHKRVTRFFPIDSLHYCAAVRHVTIPGSEGERVERFLPLDSPFARIPTPNNPPLFACILRRTSGIKVLECHSFVCKKEMAANALVRCCFHSYADNMYARHLESGSIYGSVIGGGGGGGGGDNKSVASKTPSTNGNGTSPLAVNPIQKVEQWRAYVASSSKEDSDNSQENGELVSIYDGDENHKVWAGAASTDDQQSIYADYMSTIRSSKSVSSAQRSSRPRQLTMPSSPPPPPPPNNNNMSLKNNNQTKTDTSSRPRDKSASRSMLNGNGPVNGRPTPRRFHASEFRPMWPSKGHPPPHHPGMPVLHPGYGPPQPPPPHMLQPNGSNNHRKLPKNINRMQFPPPPPPMSHSPMPFYGPPQLRSTEEPIYLPSARPMSPTASYQPSAFPYEQYYLTQSGHPHKALVHANPQMQQQSTTKPSKYKKKQKSKGENKGSDSDSKFNTGIYKKKGHLNERAFSYSIRQEHRSRSHSSLATLNFGDSSSPVNGTAATNGSATTTNGTATNGHGHSESITKVNGKGTLEHVRQNGHKNGINGNASPGPSSEIQANSHRLKKGATKTNGVKNMMNDLSLSDDGETEEIGSTREINGVSRRRIVAAANNHR